MAVGNTQYTGNFFEYFAKLKLWKGSNLNPPEYMNRGTIK